MSIPPELLEITDLFIQRLNDEVLYWQKKALAASRANDDKACQEALRAQDNAIQNLIKLAETKRNALLKSGITS
jgi:hypothetical protein